MENEAQFLFFLKFFFQTSMCIVLKVERNFAGLQLLSSSLSKELNLNIWTPLCQALNKWKHFQAQQFCAQMSLTQFWLFQSFEFAPTNLLLHSQCGGFFALDELWAASERECFCCLALSSQPVCMGLPMYLMKRNAMGIQII